MTTATVEALKWLSHKDRRLIAWDDKAKLWGPTTLGSAVVASSLGINEALAYKQVRGPCSQAGTGCCSPMRSKLMPFGEVCGLRWGRSCIHSSIGGPAIIAFFC